MDWSLCMIVRDEENVLGRCLESTGELFDEIIICDTGSEDGTKELAKSYGASVYDFPWEDDFSAARNYSFSKAKSDFIMWLDADDVIPPQTLTALSELKETIAARETDVIMLPYRTAFSEDGKPLFSFCRERILRRCGEALWHGRVHEAITPFGNVSYIDAPIDHRKTESKDPLRNLRIYEKMLSEGVVFGPRERYYYGRELCSHGRYTEAEKVLSYLVTDRNALPENRVDAARLLAACLYRIGDDAKALDSLLSALAYRSPCAELCCDIGRHYFDRGMYDFSVFWYKAALSSEQDRKSAAFISEECHGFLPYIMLCQCFYHLGDKSRAREYNELAGTERPRSEYYLHNKKILG